ncbi:MAG: hypothetical protein HRF43_18130 [Phycisphaerae bacterium]|jgi:predicted outer membrane repeat protein
MIGRGQTMFPALRTVRPTALAASLAVVLAATQPSRAVVVLYVNAGYNCPTGWCGGNSYSNLQIALQDAAAYSAFDVVEVRVAAGRYTPDLGTGLRSASFKMRNGVAIVGGYSSNFAAWNPLVYVTSLSGEINDPASTLDNSFHVVDAGGTLPPVGNTPPAWLFGCVIEMGTANGAAALDRVGAGLICVQGHPLISNCSFQQNWAEVAGAAIYAQNSIPWVTSCYFLRNFVTSGYGGALYLEGGSPLLEYSIFMQNAASTPTNQPVLDTLGYGGAVHVEDGAPTFRGCRFFGNQALHGGGAISGRGSATAAQLSLHDCIVGGNNALYVGGGGLFLKNSGLRLESCTLSGDVTSTGGEILAFGSQITAHNTIIWSSGALNRARVVPEVLQHVGLFAFDPNFTIRESGGQITLFGSSFEAAYCNVRGGQTSIYADAFSSLDYAASNLSPPVDPLLTGAGTLQAASPCINQGDPDQGALSQYDVDGEPRVRGGRVDLGADEFTDTDGDGLPNTFENAFQSGTIPGADPEGDGLTNLTEYVVSGLNPTFAPIYVNAAQGNDAYNGLAPTWQGFTTGPKKTLQAAIDAAPGGGSVLVAPGTYSGPGNTDLNLNFKNLAIRSTQGPAVTIIDGGGTQTAFQPAMASFLPTWIEGFTFKRLTAFYGGALWFSNGRNAWLKNCVLADNQASGQGGGLFAFYANLRIDGLTLRNNAAPDGSCALCYDSSLELRGDLTVEDGQFLLFSSYIDTPRGAPRGIRLGDQAVLKVTSWVPNEPMPPTVINADVTGTGSIEIDAGQQLIIGGDATVNLSGQSGDVCAVPGAGAPSRIRVDGSLVVQDRAKVLHNRIDVSLLKLGSGADIRYNNISAPLDSAGFGGEFFVETDKTGSDRVSVTCNRIEAVGDRYLDLDPDPGVPADKRPIIQGNHVEVTIAEGVDGRQGTILELRARDYHCDPQHAENCPSGDVHPGLVPWADRDQFDSDAYPANNWVLDRLTIRENAKLNLTNRQGFDFNLDRPDTLYVKDLVLEAGAILNLAGQRLYYNTLSMGAGAEVRDEPLLGFSLGIIGMNDDNEFSVRVRRRLTDPDADGDPGNPEAPPLPRGEIRRLPDGLVPGDGVMEMTTLGDGQTVPASSVAAKGHFTRAGEDSILVVFLYLFMDPNPDAELIVKISGNREVGRDNVEIARLRQEPGRPGSFGSGRFGVFHLSVPRGDLNLTRGTFIELELRGGKDPNDPVATLPAKVWIENWDPQITCSQVGRCGDLNNSFGGLINERDYLLLVAASGQAIAPDDPASPRSSYPLWCLDLSGDKYVDLTDLLRWDVFFTTRLNLCAPSAVTQPTAAFDAVTSPRTVGGLVLAGKERTLTSTPADPVAKIKYLDRLYSIAPSSVSVDAEGVTHIAADPCPRAPQPPAGGTASIGNGRLIQDNLGRLFQIHQADGIYYLDHTGTADDVLIVPPWIFLPNPADPHQTVHVGLTPTGGGAYLGEPIIDAAVRTAGGETYVYVAPVVVVDDSNGCQFKAAARLRLTAGGLPYVVERVYGQAPCTPQGLWSSVDHQQVREIELSDDGQRVYVASAQGFNGNDVILVYDAATGALLQTVPLSDGGAPTAVRAPVALFVTGQRLYVSSPVRPLDDLGLPAGDADAALVRFTLEQDGRLCTAGSCGPVSLTIHNPCIGPVTPCVANPKPANPMVGYITGISRHEGTLWVSGYVTPTYRDDEVPAGTSLFTTPTLALVRPEWFDAPPPAVTFAALDCQGLALPVSSAFIPSVPADFDGDGDVDTHDLQAFIACVTAPGVSPPPPGCAEKDFDGDGDVDQADYARLQRCYTGADRAATAGCDE